MADTFFTLKKGITYMILFMWFWYQLDDTFYVVSLGWNCYV